MSKTIPTASLSDNAARSQIQQDWANREYVEVITTSIKRITDFLNSFGESNHFLNLLTITNYLYSYLSILSSYNVSISITLY